MCSFLAHDLLAASPFDLAINTIPNITSAVINPTGKNGAPPPNLSDHQIKLKFVSMKL